MAKHLTSKIRLIAHHQELKVPTATLKQARSLPIGDFLWLVSDGREEWLAGVIVERKTFRDLIVSVWDGRFKGQANRILSALGLTRLIYIVEGAVEEAKYKSIAERAIVSLKAKGFEIARTANIVETGALLDRITLQLSGSTLCKSTLVGYLDFVHSCKPAHGCEEQSLRKYLHASEGLGSTTEDALVTYLQANGGATAKNLDRFISIKPVQSIARELQEYAGLNRPPPGKVLERLKQRLLLCPPDF